MTEDLLHLRFILLGVVWSGLVYLHFLLAHREWRRLKGGQAVDIDLEYVRMEDFLPKSFRAKARDWLLSPSLPGQTGTECIVPRGNEQIRLTGPLSFSSNVDTDDILVVNGDFRCGEGCRMSREVWARGNADIGADSHVQAIAADGALVFGAGVSVARWADSEQVMNIGSKCRIGSRATSRKAVRLELGAQALSVYAPEVISLPWDGLMGGPAAAAAAELLQIGPPEGPALPADLLQAAGIDHSKLVELGPQCWSYLGDFLPSTPIRLRAGLVVRGRCCLPGGSILDGDLKADGLLLLGHATLSSGSLVSHGDILLGRCCQFSGVIHAGGSILLGSGTRGIRREDMVAVYASEDLNVEQNVAISGKLASGSRLIVVGPSDAEDWTHQRLEGRA